MSAAALHVSWSFHRARPSIESNEPREPDYLRARCGAVDASLLLHSRLVAHPVWDGDSHWDCHTVVTGRARE